MTDAELQTEEELGTTDAEVEIESTEDSSGAELATAEEKVEVPEGYIKAEDAQKDINRQHKKFRDEERKRKKIEAEAERIKKERDELRAQSIDTTIPPVPDPYAENYQELVKARDEAIQRKTEHDAQQKALEDSERANEEARVRAEKEKDDELVQSFDSNMVKLGLNPVEVKKAAETVLEWGIDDNLQDAILMDAEGPLLLNYLANNPLEYEKLQGMSVLQQGAALNGDIRQKASLLRPQTSKAPDPPVTLTGAGVKETEDPLIAGATFE